MLLGNGDGTLQPAQNYRHGDRRGRRWLWPTSTATASSTSIDVDDSDDDGTVSVLLGNGDGTLSTRRIDFRRRLVALGGRGRRLQRRRPPGRGGGEHYGSNTVSVLLNDGNWPAAARPVAAASAT